jgi:hypothetical protein
MLRQALLGPLEELISLSSLMIAGDLARDDDRVVDTFGASASMEEHERRL